MAPPSIEPAEFIVFAQSSKDIGPVAFAKKWGLKSEKKIASKYRGLRSSLRTTNPELLKRMADVPFPENQLALLREYLATVNPKKRQKVIVVSMCPNQKEGKKKEGRKEGKWSGARMETMSLLQS